MVFRRPQARAAIERYDDDRLIPMATLEANCRRFARGAEREKMTAAAPSGNARCGGLRFRKHDKRSWAHQNLSDSQPDRRWLRFNRH